MSWCVTMLFILSFCHLCCAVTIRHIALFLKVRGPTHPKYLDKQKIKQKRKRKLVNHVKFLIRGQGVYLYTSISLLISLFSPRFFTPTQKLGMATPWYFNFLYVYWPPPPHHHHHLMLCAWLYTKTSYTTHWMAEFNANNNWVPGIIKI